MTNIPNKAEERIISALKKFQPILLAAKSKDINESDTVVIIADILSELFGYDKYHEITTEHVIKKTYCDLAIKIENKVRFLIEAKAIGLDLKEDHIKQVIDYGANLGIDWVILTNGCVWQIYKISFSKPIDKELVYAFDLTQMSHKKQDDLELLYYVSKEGIGKSYLDDYYEQKQALSRYFIGQMVLTEPVLEVIKRELRKVSPGVKISIEEIQNVLENEVLKREVLEDEKSNIAKKKIHKGLNQAARRKEKEESDNESKKTDNNNSKSAE